MTSISNFHSSTVNIYFDDYLYKLNIILFVITSIQIFPFCSIVMLLLWKNSLCADIIIMLYTIYMCIYILVPCMGWALSL